MKQRPTMIVPAVLAFALAAPVFAQNPGLERAREAVRSGTAVPDATLGEVRERVPEEAKPAIERSREVSRRGRNEALDNIGGGPEQRNRPSFPGPGAGAPFGGGFPGGAAGGPPAGAGRR